MLALTPKHCVAVRRVNGWCTMNVIIMLIIVFFHKVACEILIVYDTFNKVFVW